MGLSKKESLKGMGITLLILIGMIFVAWFVLREPSPKIYTTPTPPPVKKVIIDKEAVQKMINELNWTEVFEDMDLERWGLKKKW